MDHGEKGTRGRWSGMNEGKVQEEMEGGRDTEGGRLGGGVKARGKERADEG